MNLRIKSFMVCFDILTLKLFNLELNMFNYISWKNKIGTYLTILKISFGSQLKWNSLANSSKLFQGLLFKLDSSI